MTCPEVKGPPFSTPHPAPGGTTYPCDNLMGCGSTVGRRLEGHLSSEMYKFQHRTLLSSGKGCRALRAAGPGQRWGTQTQVSLKKAGGRRKLTQALTQQVLPVGR